MRNASFVLFAALTACTAEPSADLADTSDAAVAQAPPVAGLTLSSSDLVLSGRQHIRIEGAPANKTVYILRSFSGEGAGSCPSYLRGECFDMLDPVDVHTRITTTNGGNGSTNVDVPPARSLDGTDICFQAGVPGNPVLLSNVVCRGFGYDDDGDGVVNHRDQCEGEDDWYDWDADGTPDACDTSGRPPIFDTSEFDVTFTVTTFQSREVWQYVPSNPVGVVFAFHGTGGEATFVETPEGRVEFQAFIDAGFAVVAMDSEARASNGKWKDNQPPSQSADWQRLDALRDHLVSTTAITNNTPVFGVGFSNGCTMASYMGHAGVADGWPVQGLSFHQGNGRSGEYGSAPDVPSIFISADNDTRVEASAVQQRYDEHVSNGFDGLRLHHMPARFAPTRFARSSFIPQEDSIALHRLVADAGFFDAQGHATFSGSADDAITDMAALQGFDPPLPSKGVLKAVLAVHVLIAEFAETEADYFVDQL